MLDAVLYERAARGPRGCALEELFRLREERERKAQMVWCSTWAAGCGGTHRRWLPRSGELGWALNGAWDGLMTNMLYRCIAESSHGKWAFGEGHCHAALCLQIGGEQDLGHWGGIRDKALALDR